MVTEYVRYTIPPADQAAFTEAYERASGALDASPHCLSYELAHGIEEPERWVLRIEWDSVEGHERGFRTSPVFRAFFEAVRPFFEQIEEMRHYEPIAIAARKHEEPVAEGVHA